MKTVHPFQTASLPHWIGVRKGWHGDKQGLEANLVCLPSIAMRAHVLAIGATGSGKTTLFHHLVAQDIREGHSFCVLDLRGDLVASALALCAGNIPPERVRLLDLRERDRPQGFNPLYGAGEPYFRALNVLDVVANESDSWGVQLSETLRNALLLLAEVGEPLTSLEYLFYNRLFLHGCLKRCGTDWVRTFWLRFDTLSGDRKAAYAVPVLNKVSLLLSTKGLRGMLGHAKPLDLGKILNARGIITLVSLAADEMHGAGRMMGRLVLSSVCREIFARVDVPESKRNPVRLYVDEFEHFGTSEFEHILAEGRRFGLSLVLAHQTLAQLSAKLRSMILNNVGTKIFFRCGREDSATLSKDLTGDPQALALHKLPVGEAFLWRRGLDPVHVEINAPLLKDVGSRSAITASFVRAVRDGVPVDRRVTEKPDPAQESAARDGFTSEDWLCD